MAQTTLTKTKPDARIDTSHIVSGIFAGRSYPITRGELVDTEVYRKFELRRRVDGSATIRLYSILHPDEPFLVSVDLPAPAGDELLAAFMTKPD